MRRWTVPSFGCGGRPCSTKTGPPSPVHPQGNPMVADGFRMPAATMIRPRPPGHPCGTASPTAATSRRQRQTARPSKTARGSSRSASTRVGRISTNSTPSSRPMARAGSSRPPAPLRRSATVKPARCCLGRPSRPPNFLASRSRVRRSPPLCRSRSQQGLKPSRPRGGSNSLCRCLPFSRRGRMVSGPY